MDEIEKQIAGLTNSDLKVRYDSAVALGLLRDGRALDGLVAVLFKGDEHPHVRAQAAIALGRIGDMQAFAPLIRAFKDADENVSGNAKVALVTLVLANKERAVAPLIETLADESEMVRMWAGDMLGYYLEPEITIVPLKQALQSDNPLVRVGAQYALDYYEDGR